MFQLTLDGMVVCSFQSRFFEIHPGKVSRFTVEFCIERRQDYL